MAKLLVWTKTKLGRAQAYVDASGDYLVWVQSRPMGHNDRRENWWAASYQENVPWLTDLDSLSGAKSACEEHTKSRQTK